METRRLREKTRTGRLVIVVLLFQAMFLYGEETGDIVMRTVPTYPSVGEIFKLEFLVKGNFFSSVVAEPPENNKYFKIVGGPYIRPNIEKNGVIVTFNIVARRKGKHRLGRFVIVINGNKRVFDPGYLEVINTKPRIYWEVGKKSVRMGEPLPIVLILEKWNELVMPLSVTVRPPKNSLFEEIANNEGISIEEAKGKKLYKIPLKTFLITFSKNGRYRIPTARVILKKGVVLYTPILHVNVLQLPIKVKTTYAIGKFSLEISHSKEDVQLGGNIEISVKIEGRGNFNFLSLPVPQVGKLKATVKKEKRSIKPSTLGYEGFIEKTYIFSPPKKGLYICKIPDFPYYDMEESKVKLIKGSLINFNVSEIPIKRNNEKVQLPILELSAFERSLNKHGIYSIPLTIWLFPGPLLLLFYLIYRLYKKHRYSGIKTGIKGINSFFLIGMFFVVFCMVGAEPIDSFEKNDIARNMFLQGMEYTEKGKFENAIIIFNKLIDLYPDNNVVLYNLAYNYYMKGDKIKAEHLLRKILKRGESNKLTRDFLLQIENELKIPVMVKSFQGVPLTVLIVIGLIIYNLFFFGLVLYFASKRFIFLVTIFILGILFTCDAIYTGYALWHRTKITGIISSEGASLRRIPEKISEPWLEIEPGMPIVVIGKAGNFLLVESAEGATGWLIKGKVLFD